MGLTHFPNGITTRTTSAANTAAGADDLNCLDFYADGTATITKLSLNTANTIIGERASITGTFTSAAGTTYTPLPFPGQIIDFTVVLDTSPRKISALTVRGGSAGAISVASTTAVSCGSAFTVASPGIVMGSATVALTVNAYAEVSALNVTVTTAGSAVNGTWTAVIQRSA